MPKHIQTNCRLALTLGTRVTYSRTIQARLADHTMRMPTGIYAIKRGKRPLVLGILRDTAEYLPDHFTPGSLETLARF